jgi:hypothetical protein
MSLLYSSGRFPEDEDRLGVVAVGGVEARVGAGEGVAHRQVEEGAVAGEGALALPDAAAAGVGGGVEPLLRLEGRLVEADHPAVVGPHVGVRRPGDVDPAALQLEAGALVLPVGVELDRRGGAAGAVRPAAGDLDRRGLVGVALPALVVADDVGGRLVRAGGAGDVQGVERLHVVVAVVPHFLGLGDDEGVGRRVDDRRAGDADLRHDVRALEVAVGHGGDAGRGVDEAALPEPGERDAGG